jgi:hypothetical protein
MVGLPDQMYHTAHVATDGTKEGLVNAIYAESRKFFGGVGMNLRIDESAMEDPSKLDYSKLYLLWHMVSHITSTTKRLTGTTPNIDNQGNITDEKVTLQ